MAGAKFEAFVASTVAMTTAQTVAAVAHGLPFTPGFVLATLNAAAAPGAEPGFVSAVADATTVTFTTGNTGAGGNVSYLLGH